MLNNISILDIRTDRRIEIEEVKVTTIEEREVEIEETFIDIRLPLKDAQLLAACGEGSYVTTAIQDAGNRLKCKLTCAGYSTKRQSYD